MKEGHKALNQIAILHWLVEELPFGIQKEISKQKLKILSRKLSIK